MGSSQLISKNTVRNLYSRYKQLHYLLALVFRFKSCLRLFVVCSGLVVVEPGWSAPCQSLHERDDHVFSEPAGTCAIALKQAPFLDEMFSRAKFDSAKAIKQLDIRQVDIRPIGKEVTLSLNPSSKGYLTSAVDSRRAVDLTPLRYSQLTPGSTNNAVPRWSITTSGNLPLFDSVNQEEKNLSNGVLKKKKALPRSTSPAILSSAIPLNGSILAGDPGAPTPPPIPPCANPDPELGCLFLQDPIFPTNPPPVLYLVPRIDFFRSNNILLGIDPVNDGLIRPTLTLLAVPPLGRNTYLIASVEGSFNRYFDVPQFNYNEFRVRAGISQRLSPTMWGEIGWTNQQLFISGNKIPGFPSGTRFLNDQALRFELSRRDQLSNRLFLTSLYQFRLGFANPSDRSRILNVLYLSLGYDLQPTVQLGLDYQLAAANYTVVQRTDLYHQLLGRLTFSAFRNTQISVYGGLSFGNSTERGISFDSYILGVSMSVNLVLF